MNVYDSRILLVDDELALRDMVSAILKNTGYDNVDEATDAASADFLYRNHEYQLVLLDAMWPDESG